MDLKLTSIERTDRYLFSYEGIRNKKHERPDPTYDNSMKTYQLTDEEKANYQNTGVLKMGKALTKKDLTKEAFVARKEQGRTDLSIAREYGIHGSDISKLREQWGLTGMKTKEFQSKTNNQLTINPKAQAEGSTDFKPNHVLEQSTLDENELLELKQYYENLQKLYDNLVDSSNANISVRESTEKQMQVLQNDYEALQREHSTLQSTHRMKLEAYEDLKEDYDAQTERADELEAQVEDLTTDNQKVWETNKKLLEEKEQPSTDRYEALYKATVKALAVHLPA